ncbi:MAG: hypothetical protein Q9170_002707 [Blastenia crenularia]
MAFKSFSLLLPLLHVPPTAASSLVPPRGEWPVSKDLAQSSIDSSWSQTVHELLVNLLSLYTHPFITCDGLGEDLNTRYPSPTPATLILAVLLGTSTVVLASRFGKDDKYQPLFIQLAIIITVSSMTVKDVGLQDFVFGYMFWGSFIGLSVSWIFHRIVPAGKAKATNWDGMDELKVDDLDRDHPKQAVLV